MEVLHRLMAIARTGALLVQGDQHNSVAQRYTKKDDIQGSEQDQDYFELHRLLLRIKGLRLVPAAIQDDRDTPYATLAADIGKSVDAVKKAVERLRKRWTQILREEVAFTVQTQDEVDPELREILAVLRDECGS